MQEVFEKIKECVCEFVHERNKSDSVPCKNQRASCLQMIRVCDLTAIINQVAEEYNNGWIPCSERLPEPGEIVMVCQRYSWEQFEDKAAVTIGRLRTGKRQYWEFQHYRPDFRTGTIMDNDIICPGSEYVTAWQPLPAPYQPKGE